MADITDVLNTVAAQIAGYVYPNGTGQPSVTGKAINVFPGWPLPDQIDADMPQGIAEVSVFPVPNTEQNRTRYRPQAKVMSVVTPTITLTAGNRSLTVGGAMPSPFSAHNVAALIAGQAFIYPVQATDTLTSIATGLAALIAAKYPGTTNAGPVITLPAGVQATGRVGTTGLVTTEWERQAQLFQITVWAPDPATRATVGSAIKAALAQITFLLLPDGFGARIQYKRNALNDETQKVRVYRRDLFYEIEYATTVSQNIATVVAPEAQIEDMQGTAIVTRTY